MKIRGLKRKEVFIKSWLKRNINLPLEELKRFDSHYSKLYIKPWFQLNNIAPPKGYRVKMTEALCTVCKSWENQLKENNISSYYLAVWIDVSDFINSQVVCAVNEKALYYESLFSSDGTGVMPNDFSNVTIFSIFFNWSVVEDREVTSYDEFVGELDDYESKEDFEYNKLRFERLILKKTTNRVNVDTENLYSILHGNQVIGHPKK